MDFDKSKLYDVIILGGGPAGLTAAIYLARARYRVLVVEQDHFGGQITITEEVVNYPGIAKISGKALTDAMLTQAEQFGAEFLRSRVQSLSVEGDIKTVQTDQGTFYALGLLLATGAKPRTLGFTGEDTYQGRGVAYCATCDGEFFTGKDVFVLGGGFAAAEESVFLTKFARHVTILMRKGDFSCAASVAEHAKQHEKITILPYTTVEEVRGDDGLTYLRYHNSQTGETTEYNAPAGESFGVFVFAGYVPQTQLVQGLADLTEDGYIITDSNQKTSIDGLYAAGDVCVKSLRQVVTATGDGALAATELEKYVSSVSARIGVRAERPKAPEVPQATPSASAPASDLFDAATVQQLQTVFARMEQPLILKLFLDDRAVSKELQHYMQTLATYTDKLTVQVEPNHTEAFAPCVRIFRADGTDTGLAFHGVPGGHEFTSFILGLYNAAGTGQAIDPAVAEQIAQIDTPLHMQVFVSLSCTMCPDLVVAAQKMATLHPHIRCEVFDLTHFEALRTQYKVMSVPCLVMNEEHITFGKKTLPQILEFYQSTL